MKPILLTLLALFSFAFAYSPNDFDSLLKTYVTADGWVDYDALSANAADVAKLQSFVTELGAFDPNTLSGNEALAFWINAYNALTLNEVLTRYPVDTIRPAFLGIPDRSFFVESKHKVGAKTYFLDEIENDVIRKFDEPRIHFAINCASVSCPALLNEVYSAAKLEEQFDTQGALFVNDPNRNQFDISTGTAKLSKIFTWFKGDFEVKGGVVEFLLPYARGDVQTVLSNPELKIEYLDYDWGLNKPR